MNVIFTCGGTAGHVNPALALAGYMQERHPDLRVLFVGTPPAYPPTTSPSAKRMCLSGCATAAT